MTFSMTPSNALLNASLKRWEDACRLLRDAATHDIQELSSGLDRLEEAQRWKLLRQDRALAPFAVWEEQNDARWAERLRRLSHWKQQLSVLKSQWTAQHETWTVWQWFERAANIASRLGERWKRQAAKMEDQRLQKEAQLATWDSDISGGHERMDGFEARQQLKSLPLLVSRARKRPEEDRLNEQQRTEAQLTEDLKTLKLDIGRLANRISQSHATMQQHAAKSPGFFEALKQNTMIPVRDAQLQLHELREQLMGTALRFENGRKRIRQWSDRLDRMRCLEEAYAKPKPWWAKALKWSLMKKKPQ